MNDPWTQPDPPGQRSIRKELVFPVPPEAVWEAVATGPGIACWFYPTDLEPRVGGRITQSFGADVTEAGEVTVHEPGRRLAARGRAPESGGVAQAFEYLIEGREGGSTVLRFIHSGFSTDASFDDEYGVIDNGWDLFLGILRTYLEHFAGQPGASAQAMGTYEGAAEAAWGLLMGSARSDVDVDAIAVGAAVTLSPPGLEPLSGVVDMRHQGEVRSGFAGDVLGLRLADGVLRLAVEGRPEGPASVWAARYGYGAGMAATEASGPALQNWLADLFPASASPPPPPPPPS